MYYSYPIQIEWLPVADGVRILRVFSDQTSLHIPDTIDGQPVTEIGPYCFSASSPKAPADAFLYSTPGLSGSLPLINGRLLEEVVLPSSVVTLHNAAFYNCRKLRTLSVGNHIQAIGSDEFTNCSRLSQLIFRRDGEDDTGLSLLLERFEDNLEVLFTNEAGDITGALYFPEYYEWLDEISPAHLFSRSIHGEGFRMRKAFLNNRIDYSKYDACFENACKTESDSALCHIALHRLRWPTDLSEPNRCLYESAVTQRFDTAIVDAVTKRDFSLLQFLFTDFTPDSDTFSRARALCIEQDWGEGSAWLMEQKYRSGSFAGKSFDFDDFD